jgi:hypothetical protein
MNLTIGSTFPTTWKRIKMQYVVAAAGAAIALSVAIGAGVSPLGDSSSSPAAPASTSAVQRPVLPPHTVYIVSSAEQAAQMAVVEWMAGLAAYQGGTLEPRSFEVIDASVIGEDGLAEQFAGLPATIFGAGGIQLVDLR